MPNPEDTQTLSRGLEDLFGCEVSINTLSCVGFNSFMDWRLVSARSCPEGWYLDFFSDSRLCWHPSHPRFTEMVDRWMYEW